MFYVALSLRTMRVRVWANDSGLQQFVGNCKRLVGELLESLQKNDLSETSHKRDNLRAALRMIWKEEELISLQ